MNILKNKTINKFIALTLILAGLSFTSCSDDDDDNPVNRPIISDMEVGIGNSHIGYVGADLHIEAEVEAINKISTIDVEIHMENQSEGWVYENTWTEFSGLLNAEFHKHIDIPADAATGIYHLHFIVTDMEGNQTVFELEDLELQAIVDEEAPSINITASPSGSFSTGETISISGEITDNISLAGMLVALVRVDDNIADADVSGGNTSVIVMLHTHDFGDDPDEYDFSASIEVGAENDNNMTPAPIQGDNAWESGDYYILVKCSDQSANGAVSTHYPVTINL